MNVLALCQSAVAHFNEGQKSVKKSIETPRKKDAADPSFQASQLRPVTNVDVKAFGGILWFVVP